MCVNSCLQVCGYVRITNPLPPKRDLVSGMFINGPAASMWDLRFQPLIMKHLADCTSPSGVADADMRENDVDSVLEQGCALIKQKTRNQNPGDESMLSQ